MLLAVVIKHRSMKNLFKSVILPLLLASLLFYSCKKEKSYESCQTNQPTSNTNKPPIAVAGPDQTISLPRQRILLNGSASNDPDGSITVWQWTKLSGPSSFTIANANTVQTQVSNLLQGIYQFELKVTDNARLLSKDTVQVTVLPPIFNSNNSNVYIAGWGMNASGKAVARIWKNGVVQDLSNGQYNAKAKSVFVSGSDVYVAGWEVNASGKNVAKLWKNGVAQTLSDGQNNVMANSVYVANNDVYVAGFDGGASIYYGQALLWKNGVAQNLVSTQYNGEYFAETNSVFVSGSDVYVAGYDADNAKLWKNGVAQNFSGGDQYAEANSVVVSGNAVYVAGTRYPCAVGGCSDAILWENGQPQILQLGVAAANSVFVSGTDVYVAGGDESYAKLWKNGVVQNLSNGQTHAEAHSVFISGIDVYVAGSEGDFAKLWKNGTAYSIPGLTEANSVFVQ